MNRFEKIMANNSDSELLKIVNEQRADYEQEAVEAAEKELAQRNLSTEQIFIAEEKNEAHKKARLNRANTELGDGWKALTFIFPGLLPLLLSGALKADGYTRKAKELSKFTLYGFGFYIGILILVMVISQLG